MINKRFIYLLAFLLLTLSCGREKGPEYVATPVIEMEFGSFTDGGVSIKVRSMNTDAVYAVARTASEGYPTSQEIVEKGYEEKDGVIFIPDLKQKTEYTIYGVGMHGTDFSKTVSITVVTPFQYQWESVRNEIPSFADLDLLPGGLISKQPATWDEERLLPHVTFKDETGKEQWLHEAFLFIGSEDAKRKAILCIAEGKNKSGNQDSWRDFADYWTKKGGVVTTLDRTIGNAVSRIGKPSFKHKVVMTMPDPIMLEYFYNKNSSTTYWGQVNGRTLDFSDPADQVLAYMWFIDYVRELWNEASPEHLELAGFYILSEVLVAKPDGWNYRYKKWDKILPEVSDYLHGMNYGLYWIPYYQADGYDMTDDLGIDYTWLQPNKYWDYPEKKQKKSWSWIFNSMQTYGHGMEIEFEGSHGESGWSQYEEGVARTSSSILETVRTDNDAQGTGKGSPNPQAARNKALLREYMNEFRNAGYYGKARIATYSGTNAMYELATSPDAKDREMYLEYCNFIVNSPLRK